MSDPEVVVVPDDAAVAATAATRIAETLARAVANRGRADWATTGGSMAPAIYRQLIDAPLRDAVPWPSLHVWWGDDRYVPRDHPLSNVKPLDDILLAIAWTQSGQLALGRSGQATPVPIPMDQLHPFPTGEAIGMARGSTWCAAQLAAEVRTAGLAMQGGWPMFDLVLLGLGADGHVLSVFPDSAAFDSRDVTLAVPAPTHIEPHVERVTFNPGILSVARSILVVASGSTKAAVLRETLHDDADPRRLPARLARTGTAVWVVDEAAGAALDSSAADAP
jgi:6-phosphogluconolactonase